MKRKLLCILCIFMLALLAGCANYGSIEDALERVTIENTLPEVSEGKYTSAGDADDDIYEQQIALCDMYAQAYEKTYYQNFIGNDEKFDEDKAARICNTYRMKLDEDMSVDYYKNIYLLIKDCDDVTNKDAFLEKTNNDVKGFYDAYARYMDSEDREAELCSILVNYSERRNILALSFLQRNKQKVYDAAVNKIEKNAKTDENFRFYLNKNNNIITALNDVYNGVSSKYAERISKATTELSKNLLNSLESLTDRERLALMDELNLSTPSPTPKATATPKPSPSATPLPTQSAVPATQPPVRTAAPAVQTPVRTAVPATAEPVAEPRITPEQPEVTELPSYSFSVND